MDINLADAYYDPNFARRLIEARDEETLKRIIRAARHAEVVIQEAADRCDISSRTGLQQMRDILAGKV